jgi:hypothetical protein
MRSMLLLGLVGLVGCSSAPTEDGVADEAAAVSSTGATYPVQSSLRGEIAARIAHEKIPTPAYFFVGFGYEGAKNPASESHTFASFVRVDADKTQTWSTISWLPKTFVNDQTICIFEDFGEAAKEKIFGNPCAPVPGRNYDLAQTLAWAVAADRKLGIWGPYSIKKDLYDLGQSRVRFLESGQVSYMADDGKTRDEGGPGSAFNCMHAVSDLPNNFDRDTIFDRFDYGNWGIHGTRSVMEHYTSSPMGAWFNDRVDPSQFRTFSND